MSFRYDVVDESARALVPRRADFVEIASGGEWFEGPTWLKKTLIWSDVVGNRLLAWDPSRGTRTWLEPSFHQNGHAVDRAGRLVAASHGERAVVRRERDGRWTIVADLVDGRRFNSPNDVVVARDGAVWFTDPLYGLTNPREGYGGKQELDGQHVYRVSPRGMVGGVRCVTARHPAMPAPNGLAFSPDESVLYVADSKARHLLAFAMRYGLDGPEPGRRWIVAEMPDAVPDGLRVDPTGRIWCTAGASVQILSPGVVGEPSRLLATLHLPRTTANLDFSPDHTTLALTSTDRAYLLELGDVTA